jgi:hypothetical protein
MTASFLDVILIDNNGHIIPDQTQPITLSLKDGEKSVERIEAWISQASGGACVASDPACGLDGWTFEPEPADYLGRELTPGKASGMGLGVSVMNDGTRQARHWAKDITLKYA